jgi:zinc protease
MLGWRGFQLRRVRAVAALIALAVLWAAAPPAAGAKIKLPPVERTELDNGMVVLVLSDGRLPLVNMKLAIWGGSASDPEGQDGVCSLTASLVRKGAGLRTAGQIAEMVEFMGGRLDSYARKDMSIVEAEFLAKDFDSGISLLGDIALRPSFAPEEFQREKAKTIGVLEQVPDDPYDLADREFDMFLMGAHPYAHPTNGTIASVKGLSLEDVRGYHDVYYRPQRAVLAVVGDVKPEDVVKAVREIFGGWERSGEERSYPPPLAAGDEMRILLIDKPDATQTQIRIGNVAVSRADPDYVPLYVANVLFGGGFTSRLIDEIRVTRGLSYSPHSRLYALASGGEFVIKEYTRNEQAMETVDVTMDLVSGLRDQEVPAAELDKTKNYINGLFPLRLERPESLAETLLQVELYGLGDDYVERFPEEVNAVTAQKLLEVVRKHVAHDRSTFTLVGVAGELEEPLSKYGEVEVREIGGEGE